MKRVYPPYGYDCLYKDNCPHLNFLSTLWVFGEYERAHEVYEEHLRIIDVFRDRLDDTMKRIRLLEKENEELKAKNTALHRRQFKANKKPEHAVSLAGRKRGAPVGHPGWFRPEPARVDATVHVPAPDRCPHCGSGPLVPGEGIREHVQEDIVIRPRTVVRRYVHKEAYCSRCGRSVVKAAPDELPNAPIGPVTKSVALYLRYRIGMSYRKVEEVMREIFGLAFVPASAVGFDRAAAKRGTPLYEDLREKIRASEIVHADETSWRNDGTGHYAWYAGNADLALFHIDRHRSTDVAQHLLGDNFDGVLITDRYAAYNGVHARERQTCLAHLITRARELTRELVLMETRDTKAEAFCDAVGRLFSDACAAGGDLLKGKREWGDAPRIEKQLRATLGKICAKPLKYKPAEGLRTFLTGKDRKFLFTFLRYPGVPPTNNQAEQSIRFLVIMRKLMFGTRSATGLKTHSILPSLIITSMRQGNDPRKFLETLLVSDTVTAKAALYRNGARAP